MFKEECIRIWEKEMENKNKFTADSLYWAVKRTLAESDTYSPYAINPIKLNNDFLYGLLLDCASNNKTLPKPKHVQINGDYTTVVWKDNTSTVIKRMEGEANDPEKAILFAVMKKLFYGNNAAMKRYLQEFEDKTVVKEKKNKKKEYKDTEISLSEVKEPPKIEWDCEHCKYRDFSWDEEPCYNCRRSIYANGKKENNFEQKETI